MMDIKDLAEKDSIWMTDWVENTIRSFARYIQESHPTITSDQLVSELVFQKYLIVYIAELLNHYNIMSDEYYKQANTLT